MSWLRHSRPTDARSRSHAVARSPQGAKRHIQIGPRIRVGGTLGKIGQEVKIGAGKVLSNPIVDAGLSFIPGVGPIAAGAAGALGKALDTSNGSVGIGDIAKGGIEGYGAAKLGGLVKGALTGADGGLSLGGLISGGGADGQGNLGALGDLAGKIGSGGITSLLGGAGGAGGGMSLSSLIDPALGGLSLYNAAQLGKKSSDYATKAGDLANQSYTERAPLRTAGIQGMLNPGQGIDLSALQGIAARGGPFAAKPPTPQASSPGIPLTGVA